MNTQTKQTVYEDFTIEILPERPARKGEKEATPMNEVHWHRLIQISDEQYGTKEEALEFAQGLNFMPVRVFLVVHYAGHLTIKRRIQELTRSEEDDNWNKVITTNRCKYERYE